MTKWKINLVVVGLILVVACGDSGGGDDGNANGASNGGTAGANAAGGANSSDDASAPDGDATGGGASATGGDSATGGTNATGSSATSGSGTGGDGGSVGGTAGACTNPADKAILDTLTIPQLACEGAACAGKNIDIANVSINEAKTATCVSAEAPNLKKLSSACQQCFVGITLCVPKNCVSLLGGKSDACSMGLSLPNTDFAMCKSPAAPKAECEKCQKDNCQTAFVTCSGIQP